MSRPATEDDFDLDDNGSECVICMSECRDTLILPCRHLCLCNSCADSLRYQANNCPICRAPFRALLQIRAVQRASTVSIANNANCQDSNSDNIQIPAGYVSVSLLEALNGPGAKPSSIGDKKDSIPTVELLSKDTDAGSKVSPVGSLKRGSKEKLNGTAEVSRNILLLEIQ